MDTGRGVEPTALPAVSVVIPTYNRSAMLEEAVRAALVDATVGEVVVVDDESTDATPEVIGRLAGENARVRPVRVSNRGSSRARQAGVEAATGEVVVLLDDDVVPAPGTIDGHARWHARQTGLVVVGHMPVAIPRGRRAVQAASRLYANDYRIVCDIYERDPKAILLNFWAGNISLRRADALAVGLWSERYGRRSQEDRDLGIRLARAGMDAVFDRRLAARHLHGRDFDRFLRDAARQVSDRWRLCELHADLIGPWPGAEAYGIGLPRPARWMVQAAARPAVERLELGSLRMAEQGFRRLGVRKAQIGAAVVARAIVQHHAALAVERYGTDTPRATSQPVQ